MMRETPGSARGLLSSLTIEEFYIFAVIVMILLCTSIFKPGVALAIEGKNHEKITK